MLEAAVAEALEAEHLDRSLILSPDAFGGQPPTGGGFFYRAGVPLVNYLTAPFYLFDAMDTMDKVHAPSLVPVTRAAIRLINSTKGISAIDAFLTFYRRYPNTKTYKKKILLIDQLIHSFHIDEKTGSPAKSVASKLLKGNKKAVVRFLADLSALHPDDKTRWRLAVAGTIDRRMLRSDPPDKK